MQIGIMLEGQMGLDWPRWQRILQAAEDYGYQHVFRSDHFVNASPPDEDSLELWISLTYAASHTNRIEFGTMVAPVTFRHPVMTARMAAQIHDLSGGRLVLGLGAGWNEREHEMFGFPFYDFKTRFDMLEEALTITTLLYNSPEPVTHQGKHFSLREAMLLPRPLGGPPILIGGKGRTRTLPLTAQFADEWNASFGPIQQFRENNVYLDELILEHGRQPEDVKRSVPTQTILGKDDADLRDRLQQKGASSTDELWERGISAGTTAELVERFSEWQEAGVQRLLLQWLDLDDVVGLEMIARDVLPHFAES